MRSMFLLLSVLAAGAANVHAQSGASALSAIKLLPKADAKRIARIEAREGNPTPERWYILVHDPAEETGLHEYVVARGSLVASRSLSQFAEGLTAEEVIGPEAFKFDSDRAGKLAQQYALANNTIPATLNYQLRRDSSDGTPVWNVTCIDATGRALGGVVVAADKGTVLSHNGFPLEPAPGKLKGEEDDEESRARSRSRDREAPSNAPKKRYVVRNRPEPVRQAPPQEKPNIFQRIFGGR